MGHEKEHDSWQSHAGTFPRHVRVVYEELDLGNTQADDPHAIKIHGIPSILQSDPLARQTQHAPTPRNSLRITTDPLARRPRDPHPQRDHESRPSLCRLRNAPH